jgi:hypothetical protein
VNFHLLLKAYFTVYWVSLSRDFLSFSKNFPFLILIHYS